MHRGQEETKCWRRADPSDENQTTERWNEMHNFLVLSHCCIIQKHFCRHADTQRTQQALIAMKTAEFFRKKKKRL